VWRPRTSVTEDVVAHADAIIREDWSIMLRFIAYELGVSYGSAHNIMHEQLGRTKTCARWVPHLLTPEQQAERVRICRLWLQMFEPHGPRRLSDVITGDECWISFFTMKDKQSNMVWLAEDEPRPEVLKTGFRSRKRMFTIFFNSQGVVSVNILPAGATVTARYYTDTVLPGVLQERQEPVDSRSRVAQIKQVARVGADFVLADDVTVGGADSNHPRPGVAGQSGLERALDSAAELLAAEVFKVAAVRLRRQVQTVSAGHRVGDLAGGQMTIVLRLAAMQDSWQRPPHSGSSRPRQSQSGKPESADSRRAVRAALRAGQPKAAGSPQTPRLAPQAALPAALSLARKAGAPAQAPPSFDNLVEAEPLLRAAWRRLLWQAFGPAAGVVEWQPVVGRPGRRDQLGGQGGIVQASGAAVAPSVMASPTPQPWPARCAAAGRCTARPPGPARAAGRRAERYLKIVGVRQRQLPRPASVATNSGARWSGWPLAAEASGPDFSVSASSSALRGEELRADVAAYRGSPWQPEQQPWRWRSIGSCDSSAVSLARLVRAAGAFAHASSAASPGSSGSRRTARHPALAAPSHRAVLQCRGPDGDPDSRPGGQAAGQVGGQPGRQIGHQAEAPDLFVGDEAGLVRQGRRQLWTRKRLKRRRLLPLASQTACQGWPGGRRHRAWNAKHRSSSLRRQFCTGLLPRRMLTPEQIKKAYRKALFVLCCVFTGCFFCLCCCCCCNFCCGKCAPRDDEQESEADAFMSGDSSAKDGPITSQPKSATEQTSLKQEQPPDYMMYDLERGLNAYKYKWSGTDPEPQFLRKEKSSEEEATTGLPTEDSSSSCVQCLGQRNYSRLPSDDTSCPTMNDLRRRVLPPAAGAAAAPAADLGSAKLECRPLAAVCWPAVAQLTASENHHSNSSSAPASGTFRLSSGEPPLPASSTSKGDNFAFACADAADTNEESWSSSASCGAFHTNLTVLGEPSGMVAMSRLDAPPKPPPLLKPPTFPPLLPLRARMPSSGISSASGFLAAGTSSETSMNLSTPMADAPGKAVCPAVTASGDKSSSSLTDGVSSPESEQLSWCSEPHPLPPPPLMQPPSPSPSPQPTITAPALQPGLGVRVVQGEVVDNDWHWQGDDQDAADGADAAYNVAWAAAREAKTRLRIVKADVVMVTNAHQNPIGMVRNSFTGDSTNCSQMKMAVPHRMTKMANTVPSRVSSLDEAFMVCTRIFNPEKCLVSLKMRRILGTLRIWCTMTADSGGTANETQAVATATRSIQFSADLKNSGFDGQKTRRAASSRAKRLQFMAPAPGRGIRASGSVSTTRAMMEARMKRTDTVASAWRSGRGEAACIMQIRSPPAADGPIRLCRKPQMKTRRQHWPQTDPRPDPLPPAQLRPGGLLDAKPPGGVAGRVLLAVVGQFAAVELGEGLLSVPVSPVGGPAAGLHLFLVDAPVGQLLLEHGAADVHGGVQPAGAVVVENHGEHAAVPVEEVLPGVRIEVGAVHRGGFGQPGQPGVRDVLQSGFVSLETDSANIDDDSVLRRPRLAAAAALAQRHRAPIPMRHQQLTSQSEANPSGRLHQISKQTCRLNTSQQAVTRRRGRDSAVAGTVPDETAAGGVAEPCRIPQGCWRPQLPPLPRLPQSIEALKRPAVRCRCRRRLRKMWRHRHGGCSCRSCSRRRHSRLPGRRVMPGSGPLLQESRRILGCRRRKRQGDERAGGGGEVGCAGGGGGGFAEAAAVATAADDLQLRRHPPMLSRAAASGWPAQLASFCAAGPAFWEAPQPTEATEVPELPAMEAAEVAAEAAEAAGLEAATEDAAATPATRGRPFFRRPCRRFRDGAAAAAAATAAARAAAVDGGFLRRCLAAVAAAAAAAAAEDLLDRRLFAAVPLAAAACRVRLGRPRPARLTCSSVSLASPLPPPWPPRWRRKQRLSTLTRSCRSLMHSCSERRPRVRSSPLRFGAVKFQLTQRLLPAGVPINVVERVLAPAKEDFGAGRALRQTAVTNIAKHLFATPAVQAMGRRIALKTIE
uniref:HTH_Tnp_4 domain-containing protein n=1 Tax=Macrostomum lignano TaxID=282301 RepID=A0A1I8I3Y0_9PLAT